MALDGFHHCSVVFVWVRLYCYILLLANPGPILCEGANAPSLLGHDICMGDAKLEALLVTMNR